MTTLKAIRERKRSIQSTQKITVAMKMVAGAKLHRAQEQVEAARPYAHRMSALVQNLAAKAPALDSLHPLLMGTGSTQTHLILVAASDRGLCGGFNVSIIKEVYKLIEASQAQGQTVKLFCVGRRGRVMLEKTHKNLIVESFEGIGWPRLSFADAQRVTDTLLHMFKTGFFDICTILYNHFKSALHQEVQIEQLIPLKKGASLSPGEAIYGYEPNEDDLLTKLLPQNVAVQMYKAFLENAASEEGARMTAMENASRNAEEMIRDLTLTYNRTRQAHITRELIEIISGAEAL